MAASHSGLAPDLRLLASDTYLASAPISGPMSHASLNRPDSYSGTDPLAHSPTGKNVGSSSGVEEEAQSELAVSCIIRNIARALPPSSTHLLVSTQGAKPSRCAAGLFPAP